MKIKTLLLLATANFYGCVAQTKKEMTTNNNPLLCNPETGICEIPGAANTSDNQEISAINKPVRIIYFTDPICSSCWGIEPQLRRLKLEYGQDVEIEYHMGGLLPDWSYNSGGISKPSDVAYHWDEVSVHYKMPIDGDVWLEDPLDSSYPPSIAFKAAQLQNEKKAVVFLRHLREMVFLQKKNITKWEVIEQAAIKTGLDVVQLRKDYEGQAKELFQADLSLAKQMGVRGFPSVFVTNAAGNSEFIYGTKPYSQYENGIRKIYPDAHKKAYKKDWESLFEKYPTLTLREFAELGDVSFQEAEEVLEKLVAVNKLKKFVTKNGAMWMKE
jgi:predicted DsbA family dithiol-disulfide isomerase